MSSLRNPCYPVLMQGVVSFSSADHQDGLCSDCGLGKTLDHGARAPVRCCVSRTIVGQPKPHAEIWNIFSVEPCVGQG